MTLFVKSVCGAVLVLSAIGVLAAGGNSADVETVRIYLDADRTGMPESALSIEQGIRTALSEVGGKLNGKAVELVVRDHRGNTRRSRKHLDEYLSDERALLVFSGLHSPPLLATRDFINENDILVLDPWAAAAPITRYPSSINWIFRLSVDDSKAGAFLVDQALKYYGCKRPALLLENTGWGRSNEKNMMAALRDQGLEPVSVNWFNWNLKESGARILLRSIAASGADAIILVANAPEGKTLARAMISLPSCNRLPICSHWGITGGDFSKAIGPKLREQLGLCFLQTGFSFVSDCDDDFGTAVFERAAGLFPESIRNREDIESPVGFIHAYDLTKVLIAAVEQCGLTGNIQQDRTKVRNALENLETPVRGLIKTYRRPFSPYSEDNPDGHEALSEEDFAMARYGAGDEVILETVCE